MNCGPCDKCGKTVYQLERVALKSHNLHQKCFKCDECGIKLTFQNYRGLGKRVLCETHYNSAPKDEEELGTYMKSMQLKDTPTTSTATDKPKKTKEEKKEEKKKEKELKKKEKEEKKKMKEEKKKQKKDKNDPEQKKNDIPDSLPDNLQEILPEVTLTQEDILEPKKELEIQNEKEETKEISGLNHNPVLSEIPGSNLEESTHQIERRKSVLYQFSSGPIPFPPDFDHTKISLKDVIPPEDIQQEIGWHGTISRDDLSRILLSCSQGTYLTRWSDRAHSYVLSYRDRSLDSGIENVAYIFPDLSRKGSIFVRRDDTTVVPFNSLSDYIEYMKAKGLITQPVETNIYGLSQTDLFLFPFDQTLVFLCVQKT